MAHGKPDLPDDLLSSKHLGISPPKVDVSGGNDEKFITGALDEQKDQLNSENNIPLSPQWLYSKPNDSKLATPADSFLADLDELSDNEIDVPNEVVDADEMDEDVDGELADIEALNCVDSTRGDPTGKTGRNLKEEIQKKIAKWREPPPANQPKSLPVPDSEQKKKRGGRRLRKMKERYAITDMRKLANRMHFGIPEESFLGDALGERYGMLAQAGNGQLHVSVGQSKLAAKVAKKFKERSYGSSGATSGLTCSLAFTPVQGIELSNPQAHGSLLRSGTQSTYFSETGTFSKLKRKRI